jgi:hypothetical protein
MVVVEYGVNTYKGRILLRPKIIIITIIIMFIRFYGYSQNKINVVDSLNLEPIYKVLLLHSNKIMSTSDNHGVLNLNIDLSNPIEITLIHDKYKEKKILLNFKKDTIIFLEPKTIELEGIEIDKKIIDKKIIQRTLIRTFFNYKINLSHEDKIAQLIVKNEEKLKLSKIKINVVDIFGVKNLKYLPFKVSIYDINEIDFKPGKSIYTSEVIRKNNNKKWVEIDIDFLNLFSNEKDLFLVFEILDKNMYPVELINSQVGLIAAVPQVKARIYNPRDKRKCYLLRKKNNSEETIQWNFIECQFELKFEYKILNEKD